MIRPDPFNEGAAPLLTGVTLVAIVLLLALLFGIWVLTSLLGLIVTLLIAAFVGWLADKIYPGRLPAGWLGAIVAGLLGSLLGGVLLGDAGPEVGGIAVLPALVGALILAVGIEVYRNGRAPRLGR
jgi:uncharacterized membrane protein YeaQ/YmgE (transglycosylase-associated protein family)